MGHRHLFNAPQMFDNDHDQSWNLNTDQSYLHLARSNAVENGPFFYSMENMSSEGVHFPSPWTSQPRPNGYNSLGQNELQPCLPDVPGPSQNSYMHRSSLGTVSAVPDNYFPHATSSNYDMQTSYGIDGGFTEIAIDSGRVHQKRKSPGVPAVCERGSSSIYYSGATSSDVPIYSEFRPEITNTEVQHGPWDRHAATPGYRGNSLSIRGEGSLRNVRSRSGVDLETSVRTNLSDNHPHNSFHTSHTIEHPGAVDISGQTSNPLTTEWSHINMSPAHGRVVIAEPRVLGHEPNQFFGASSSANAPLDTGGYDFISSRNPAVPQAFHGTSSHSVRGPRNSYSHRSAPGHRSSNSMRLGNAGPPEEGMRPVAESYSRLPRPLSATGWRNSDRNRRSRISNERYRSFPDEACAHDRMPYEGFMITDRSTVYSSRSSIDQHRDLRLDIDNMSYEELLALGERIGTVNTGLSEDSISKCLRETIHCASDQIQDEETCVICLEVYNNMDDVGTLKTCSHDFHVKCIKKWLSMKNLCPICKTTALAEDKQDK